MYGSEESCFIADGVGNAPEDVLVSDGNELTFRRSNGFSHRSNEVDQGFDENFFVLQALGPRTPRLHGVVSASFAKVDPMFPCDIICIP